MVLHALVMSVPAFASFACLPSPVGYPPSLADLPYRDPVTVLVGREGAEQFHHSDHQRSATCSLAARV